MSTKDEMQNYTKIEDYRGFSIIGSIMEKPTTSCIGIRIGTYEGDIFISKFPTFKREFDKLDGAINAGMYMLDQVKTMVDEHIGVDTGRR